MSAGLLKLLVKQNPVWAETPSDLITAGMAWQSPQYCSNNMPWLLGCHNHGMSVCFTHLQKLFAISAAARMWCTCISHEHAKLIYQGA